MCSGILQWALPGDLKNSECARIFLWYKGLWRCPFQKTLSMGSEGVIREKGKGVERETPKKGPQVLGLRVSRGYHLQPSSTVAAGDTPTGAREFER
jgi:hypothetical protein